MGRPVQDDLPSGYDHTQRTWYAPLLGGIAVLLLVAAPFSAREGPGAAVVLAVVALVLAFFAASMGWLRVRDAGDALEVRFGPLPVFRKTLPFRDVTGAEPTRSHWLEGWGLRWSPRLGWLWNASGLDCVRVDRASHAKPFRIGTDDPEGLALFLRSRARAR